MLRSHFRLVVATFLVFLTIGTIASISAPSAVAAATINVIGGFLVTDRMLEMFKPRRRSEDEE